ncbi:teneurin-2 isoform X1 [Lates japonicus]|uniref:Teneurin-2 isoform X1 n=1 Tax=Lates japonicus TaxID=270547 RepID=A0AAD3NN91_LATJO|nr:teneurin-2 isoform X1 [Lates japonicus]
MVTKSLYPRHFLFKTSSGTTPLFSSSSPGYPLTSGTVYSPPPRLLPRNTFSRSAFKLKKPSKYCSWKCAAVTAIAAAALLAILLSYFIGQTMWLLSKPNSLTPKSPLTPHVASLLLIQGGTARGTAQFLQELPEAIAPLSETPTTTSLLFISFVPLSISPSSNHHGFDTAEAIRDGPRLNAPTDQSWLLPVNSDVGHAALWRQRQCLSSTWIAGARHLAFYNDGQEERDLLSSAQNIMPACPVLCSPVIAISENSTWPCYSEWLEGRVSGVPSHRPSNPLYLAATAPAPATLRVLHRLQGSFSHRG